MYLVHITYKRQNSYGLPLDDSSEGEVPYLNIINILFFNSAFTIPNPTHLVRGENLVQLSRMIYISSVTDTLFHAEHKKTKQHCSK